MSSEPDSTEFSLPLPALERIDNRCLEFEAAWKAGQAPRIEDYLGDAQGVERGELLRQLLLLDLDYRRLQADPPTEEKYRGRCSDDCKIVANAFGEFSMGARFLPVAGHQYPLLRRLRVALRDRARRAGNSVGQCEPCEWPGFLQHTFCEVSHEPNMDQTQTAYQPNCATAADERRLVVGSLCGLRLVDLWRENPFESHVELFTNPCQTNLFDFCTLSRFTYSTDHRCLLTRSTYGIWDDDYEEDCVRVWHLEISDLVEIAKQNAGRSLTAAERRYFGLAPDSPP